MSDSIKHECGIALIRFLKPLEYYITKYGSPFYCLNKVYLLMEKQHNRGQDGAGLATIKFDMQPGEKYLNRNRSNSQSALKDIFKDIYSEINKENKENSARINDVNWLKKNSSFYGELYLGHLRYSTFGKNDVSYCHPHVRENYWQSKNLVIAGNFNLTNVNELFQGLVKLGQHPIDTSDTVTILERIGHFLDDENKKLYNQFKAEGYTKQEISPLIAKHIDIKKILTEACQNWDGGYVIGGMLGHGDAFALRDPWGIRPAYYLANEEVVVLASERPAIQTTFNVAFDDIKELTPGHALIIKKDGHLSIQACQKPMPIKPCSFERIYFSRGTDKEIYSERKILGKLLSPAILRAINHDLDNTVFSYIPNTASSAFYGLIDELNTFLNKVKKDLILNKSQNLTPKDLEDILQKKIHIEKVAVKDLKLRTFITQNDARDDLVGHVYDITYGTISKGKDKLVIIDDSIVRGTTLKKSILSILSRLNPTEIIIASSSPQVRYPDCYGIDMSQLDEFIAFKAAIELLKETHQEHIINDVYKKCMAQQNCPKEEIINHVKDIYDAVKTEQISAKIAEMVKPEDMSCKVSIVFQTIEDLHTACPQHKGDWYFTGNYPTPGGNKVVNTAFINYIQGKQGRTYSL